MTELYEHQRRIIADDPKKCGIFWGTGSAKTLTALLLARGKTLIIAPKTQVLDKNWERDNEKHGVHADITVISKEYLRAHGDELPECDTLILDEAHAVASVAPQTRWRKKKQEPKTSQTYDALLAYIARVNPPRLYALTATPIRSPMSVYALATILGQHWDFYDFRQAFYVRLPMPGRDVYAPKTDTATQERLARAVQKLGYTGRLEDFADVPEQTYKDIYVDLTPEQKKRLATIALDFPEPIVQVGKRHQIENGVLAGDEWTKPETFPSKKLDVLLDLALEFPRMIIFARFREQIETFKQAFECEGYHVIIMTGDTKDRGQVIADANTRDRYIFIVSAQISAGWELPECPVMVFASRTYSIVDYIQAQGRILRANALKKNLYINLITKGGVDEAVHKALTVKKSFDEKLYATRS